MVNKDDYYKWNGVIKLNIKLCRHVGGTLNIGMRRVICGNLTILTLIITVTRRPCRLYRLGCSMNSKPNSFQAYTKFTTLHCCSVVYLQHGSGNCCRHQGKHLISSVGRSLPATASLENFFHSTIQTRMWSSCESTPNILIIKKSLKLTKNVSVIDCLVIWLKQKSRFKI